MWIYTLEIFLLSMVLTIIFKELFTKYGRNLYTPIRGGTPRAVGIAPFLILILFFPAPGNYLITIMGICAFIDDIIGRKKIKQLKIEIGQLSRGMGMLIVTFIGYFYYGPISILIAFMIQPLNIADMQPGTACTTIIVMCSTVLITIYTLTSTIYYPLLLLLVVCIGYAPLDYKGKIMMGEIGNHTFAIGLGISYIFLADIIGNLAGITIFIPIITIILILITILLIAFIRRKNLNKFLENNLNIKNPNYGDYYMDILTGGGLGDLLRRLILKKRAITIKNKILIHMGFRRLIYNPYSK